MNVTSMKQPKWVIFKQFWARFYILYPQKCMSKYTDFSHASHLNMQIPPPKKHIANLLRFRPGQFF